MALVYRFYLHHDIEFGWFGIENTEQNSKAILQRIRMPVICGCGTSTPAATSDVAPAPATTEPSEPDPTDAAATRPVVLTVFADAPATVAVPSAAKRRVSRR